MPNDVLFIALFSIFLLCIGSLISAFLFRWPTWCEFHWKKEAHDILELDFNETPPLSFTHGRSQCPQCHNTLSILDLLPVFSYLFLSGKCRHCKKPIGRTYLILELITLTMCLPLLFLEVSLTYTILTSLIFCCLLCISLFDFQHQWIPDELNGLLIFFSLILALQSESSVTLSVYGLLFGYGGIYLIRLIYLNIKKIEIIGLGDAKLLAGIGAWLGVGAISYILFLASVLGLIAFLFHRNRQTAFGPYLCIASYFYFWYPFL